MFLDALKAAFRGSFHIAGRAERLEHWTFLFFTACLLVGMNGINSASNLLTTTPLNYLTLLFLLWLVVANVTLMVRRLHDHNFSGLLLLLPFVFLSTWFFGYEQKQVEVGAMISTQLAGYLSLAGAVGAATSLVVFMSFFARPGDNGDNDYGPPC